MDRSRARGGPVLIWTPAERTAWAPPPRLTTTEWAERYVVLSPRISSQAGPYDASLTPYARGPMDALSDDEHDVVVLLKSVQAAGSQMVRNALGRWVHIAPGPALIVFPTEDSAKEQMQDRVIPMLEDSPDLAALQTGRKHDIAKGRLFLTTCTVYVGWSGSPQALASRPIRYVVLDEVDKYPEWRGKEADPVSLALERTTTYERKRKIAILSTPTTPAGPIWGQWESCADKREWWAPCPLCGALQLLEWEQFGWEGESPDDLEAGIAAVWYECVHCKGRIPPQAKSPFVDAGQWVSQGYEPGEHPLSKRVGFHVWAAFSPFVSWPRLCAQYLRARAEGLGAWQSFRNNYQGLPFVDEQSEIRDEFVERGKKHLAGVVPAWAHVVIASADTQAEGWWYMVRAWGAGGRSRLLSFGFAHTERDLCEATIFRLWRKEVDNGRMPTRVLVVDAGGGTETEDGSITDRVLALSATDPRRIWAVKGRGGRRSPGDPRVSMAKTGKAGKFGVPLRMLDTQHYKDVLATRINSDEEDGPELWEESDCATPEYGAQMSSEHKLQINGRFVWVPKVRGIANHLWDCATYQCAAYDMLGGPALRRPDAPTQPAVPAYGKREGGTWKVGRG